MKGLFPLVFLWILLPILNLGCATQIYNGPEIGPSGDLQGVIAKSIEEAFSSVPEEIWSHRISMEVIAPSGRNHGFSGFIRQQLEEIIAHHGGSLQPPYDLSLRVLVPVSGNLITERRMSLTMNVGSLGMLRIPLFYGETFRGLTRTVIFHRDEGGKLQQLLEGEKGRTSHEVYWFWVLGPFESEALPQF